MKIKIYICGLLALATSPICMVHGEETSPGGIVHGPKAGFNISAPEGWVLDTESGKGQDMPCVLYPAGSSWADAKTGKTLWTSNPRQAGNAAIVHAGNLLFVLKDDAELMVARSNPGGFEPIKTYTVADSATWPAPSVSGNRIFVRDLSKIAMWALN